MKHTLALLALLLSVRHAQSRAAENPKPQPPTQSAAITPTEANVHYGEGERQVLDFYKAESSRPTPLVFFIHGGGWVAGDKQGVDVKPYLNVGISVVSINYRYTWQAQLEGMKPPVKAPLDDAARALQFVRSKAAAWKIDKARIGASGSSAGACSSLWLAFHNDMADPSSSDPVARESTRLWCGAVTGAQTSLDPKELKEWTPNSRYGGHAFGFMDPHDIKTRDTRFAEFLEHRDELLPLIKEYSPIEHVSAQDAPVYLIYASAPALGQWTGAQTTLDPQQMKDWTPNSSYGGHAFGFKGNPEKKLSQFAEFLAGRESIIPWIAEYSPYALVTADDPPVYLRFNAPPAIGQEQADPTHSANFGVKLQEHCQEMGVPCELAYPDAPNVKHASSQAYLIESLKAPTAKAAAIK